MEFEFDNNMPIYIQLVDQLKIYIVSGYIKPGEKLLSVRDFALEIKVNPNTVQKALSELESLGLIYTERTNGKYVTDNQELIDKYRQEYAYELSRKYLLSMKKIGLGKKEVIEYLDEMEENEDEFVRM